MEKQGKSYTLEMHITTQDLAVSPGVQELLWIHDEHDSKTQSRSYHSKA